MIDRSPGGSAAANDWPRVRDRLVGSGQPSILIFPTAGSVCFRGLTRQWVFEETGRIGSIRPPPLVPVLLCVTRQANRNCLEEEGQLFFTMNQNPNTQKGFFLCAASLIRLQQLVAKKIAHNGNCAAFIKKKKKNVTMSP